MPRRRDPARLPTLGTHSKASAGAARNTTTTLKELEAERQNIWKVKRVKTVEHHYHASLKRLMASRPDVETRTRKDRQREWLKVAVYALQLRKTHRAFREHRIRQIKAANDIRINWRIFMLRRYIHILC